MSQFELAVPRTLWRIAWAILITVVLVGVITLFVLANGVADPQRAGPLLWQHDMLTSHGGPNEESWLGDAIALPNAPFTLEITGVVQPTSDPGAAWGITVKDSNAQAFGIYLNGYRFLSIPPIQPDYRPFIHILSPGQPNKITLDVQADATVTVRINDEIAWQGKFLLPKQAQISLIGGPASDAHLEVSEIALYAPQK